MANKKCDYKVQFRQGKYGKTKEEYVTKPKGDRPSKAEAKRMILSRPGYMTLQEDDVEVVTLKKVNEREAGPQGPVDESMFGF